MLLDADGSEVLVPNSVIMGSAIVRTARRRRRRPEPSRDQPRLAAAISRKARSNTSGGCPPLTRCLRSMMIAGTPLMPSCWKNRSLARTSSANSPESRIARARPRPARRMPRWRQRIAVGHVLALAEIGAQQGVLQPRCLPSVSAQCSSRCASKVL